MYGILKNIEKVLRKSSGVALKENSTKNFQFVPNTLDQEGTDIQTNLTKTYRYNSLVLLRTE